MLRLHTTISLHVLYYNLLADLLSVLKTLLHMVVSVSCSCFSKLLITALMCICFAVSQHLINATAINMSIINLLIDYYLKQNLCYLCAAVIMDGIFIFGHWLVPEKFTDCSPPKKIASPISGGCRLWQ